ncbi:MAG: polynucleotide adenylyltransferase PcnB [Ferrovum sp.]|nr:polynucleotide adenylyltransferase PcnB [Ferrovum sp.]
MIRRLIHKVFGAKKSRKLGQLRTLTATQHPLRPQSISPCALRVVKTLQEQGYQAFIVGGAVRDLLLQIPPKDFDVATNATPEQIRRIIRRSRIIGRRFQIIHVPCQNEIVEVTTFRGHASHDHHSQTDEHGRLTRDNVFGTLEEDAARRDFTANALYYDPVHNTLLDYFSGVEDIAAHQLVMIGDPASRFREDPVRLLRAVRFIAKLGFTANAQLAGPLRELGPLLAPIPESRLFDELLKLLLSGRAQTCLEQLRHYGLHSYLLPQLDAFMAQAEDAQFLRHALENTDLRLRENKPVSPGFMLAALFWPAVRLDWKRRTDSGEPQYPALFAAMDTVLHAQRQTLPIPRRFDGIMKEIWGLQPRFTQRSGQRPFRLLEHPRFRAGYDFLCLRAENGEVDNTLGDWWTTFQEAAPEERESLLLTDVRKPRSRRRKRS